MNKGRKYEVKRRTKIRKGKIRQGKIGRQERKE